MRSDGKDKNSVVSFTLTDEPQHIDLQTSNSKEEVRALYTADFIYLSKLFIFVVFSPSMVLNVKLFPGGAVSSGV